jgi:hypothetical protein
MRQRGLPFSTIARCWRPTHRSRKRANSSTLRLNSNGFRCGAIIEAGRLRLISRQGTNFSSWFPKLADLPADVSSTDALLDGEVIAGAGDIESFNTLLRRARLRGRSIQNALPVSFVAFDLLWHDGADLTQLPLEERRTQLRAIVTKSSRLAVSRIYADGPALLSIAAAHGLEGVVGKDQICLRAGAPVSILAQDESSRSASCARMEWERVGHRRRAGRNR